jgi:hypothetical protein
MMSKSKKKRSSPRRWPLIAVMIVVVVGIVSAIVLVQGERGGFKTLNGRWLRLDGGYIFEIRAVDPSGKIDGLYFNPRPINIAKAEATAMARSSMSSSGYARPITPAARTLWCTIGSRTNSEGPIFRRLWGRASMCTS